VRFSSERGVGVDESHRKRVGESPRQRKSERVMEQRREQERGIETDGGRERRVINEKDGAVRENEK
jgi:hypothetical protein